MNAAIVILFTVVICFMLGWALLRQLKNFTKEYKESVKRHEAAIGKLPIDNLAKFYSKELPSKKRETYELDDERDKYTEK